MTANLTPEALRALAAALDAWSPLVSSGYEVPAAGQQMASAASALRAIADRDASLAACGFAEGVEAAAKAIATEVDGMITPRTAYGEGRRDGMNRAVRTVRGLTPPVPRSEQEMEAPPLSKIAQIDNQMSRAISRHIAGDANAFLEINGLITLRTAAMMPASNRSLTPPAGCEHKEVDRG